MDLSKENVIVLLKAEELNKQFLDRKSAQSYLIGDCSRAVRGILYRLVEIAEKTEGVTGDIDAVAGSLDFDADSDEISCLCIERDKDLGTVRREFTFRFPRNWLWRCFLDTPVNYSSVVERNQ